MKYKLSDVNNFSWCTLISTKKPFEIVNGLNKSNNYNKNINISTPLDTNHY